MAAPTFVAADADDGTAGSVVVDKPTGTLDGDLLLTFIGVGDGWVITQPGGWTLLRDTEAGIAATNPRSVVYYKWASSEPADYLWIFNVTGGLGAKVLVAAYRDVDDDPFVSHGQSNTQRVAPSVASEIESLLVCWWNGKVNTGSVVNAIPPIAMTERHQFLDPDRFCLLADQAVNAGTTGGKTLVVEDVDGPIDESFITVRPNLSVVLRHLNRPPDAPELLSMTGGTVIDRTVANTGEWEFSDIDTGDTQTAYDVQARPVGSGTWTVEESGTVGNEFHEFAALTFTAGDWEWQARTYDSDDEVGAWSASGFFTAADPPTAPVWTDPADGATITTNTYTVDWTVTEQTAYQIRVVADDAGSPDTSTVYQTVSGGGGPRSHALTFPTNEIWLHPQIRVQVNGLWSDWDSIRNFIEFTPPATPILSVVAGAEWSTVGAVTITVTNPTPEGDQPDVVSNDLWRRRINPDTAEAIGDEVELVAGITGPFVDWKVASGHSYAYSAVANGDNGTTSQSDWSA